MVNHSSNFVIYHLGEALVGAIADYKGEKTLSRHLHARAKLRLITMSDEELQKLARLVAYPPERSAEMVYQKLKGEVKELKLTAKDWTKDLLSDTRLDPKRLMNRRILVIENEPSSKTELVSALTQAGFIVVDVPDYSKALQKINQFNPELIIMETLLPDCDGFKACRELRNLYDIPVILLGQDSSDETWKKVTEADADIYELKPCSYPVLVARAKAILRRIYQTAT